AGATPTALGEIAATAPAGAGGESLLTILARIVESYGLLAFIIVFGGIAVAQEIRRRRRTWFSYTSRLTCWRGRSPRLCLPARWLAWNRLRVPPIVASLVFNGVLVTWHLPFLYEATLTNEGIHVLEHLSFLATGVLFWWPIIAPAKPSFGLSPIGKIAYLGFAGIPPTILGIAFILSPSVLYPFYAAAPRVSGLGPLEDQQLAGLVMFGLGNLIYFAATAVLFFALDRKEA